MLRCRGCYEGLGLSGNPPTGTGSATLFQASFWSEVTSEVGTAAVQFHHLHSTPKRAGFSLVPRGLAPHLRWPPATMTALIGTRLAPFHSRLERVSEPTEFSLPELSSRGVIESIAAAVVMEFSDG